MASYQDLETRLAKVERKLEFIMGQFRVKKVTQSVVDPSKVMEEVLSLAQVYREIQTENLSPMVGQE